MHPAPPTCAVQNMPRGGTLVLCPPTLVQQWAEQLERTDNVGLRCLIWNCGGIKGSPEKTLDARQLANDYDVILTTPQVDLLFFLSFFLAACLPSLPSIREGGPRAEPAGHQQLQKPPCATCLHAANLRSTACPCCCCLQNISKHVLHNVFWWRIVVDEAQQNMAGFLADHGHR